MIVPVVYSKPQLFIFHTVKGDTVMGCGFELMRNWSLKHNLLTAILLNFETLI